jgi:hypothetical protein
MSAYTFEACTDSNSVPDHYFAGHQSVLEKVFARFTPDLLAGDCKTQTHSAACYLTTAACTHVISG